MFRLSFGSQSHYNRTPRNFRADTVIKTNLIFNRVVMNAPHKLPYSTAILSILQTKGKQEMRAVYGW